MKLEDFDKSQVLESGFREKESARVVRRGEAFEVGAEGLRDGDVLAAPCLRGDK